MTRTSNEELRQLLANVSPENWGSEPTPGRSHTWEIGPLDEHGFPDWEREVCMVFGEVNRALVVTMKNSLPSLLDENDALAEKLKARGCCEVCWTSSWSPAPPDDPDAVQLKDKSYARCDMCWSVKQNSALAKRCERLEKVGLGIRQNCYLDDNVINRHAFTTVSCEALRELFAAIATKETL